MQNNAYFYLIIHFFDSVNEIHAEVVIAIKWRVMCTILRYSIPIYIYNLKVILLNTELTLRLLKQLDVLNIDFNLWPVNIAVNIREISKLYFHRIFFTWYIMIRSISAVF